MGLFSRNESAAAETGRRPVSRSSQSSEAQASDLRGRARRRLIGALALVLAAVIIVPMLFDSSAPPDQVASTPVVVPAIVPPPPPEANVALAPTEPGPGDANGAPPASEAPASGGAAGDVAGALPDAVTPAQPSPQASTQPPASEPAAGAKPKPVDKPADKPAVKHEPKPSANRSDDGSVAIALLEGRSPGKKAAAPAAKGEFILQIAAYTSDKDAQTRRDRLVSSGVTNTYVENAVSNGKTTYRLRVGPFPTREAAQAAQARLRALGYDNGFISTK